MDLTTMSMLDDLCLPPSDVELPEGESKNVVLRNLCEMPRIGLGCGHRASFRPEVVQFAYESCGVRLFDTCSHHGTEECLREALFDSGLVKDRKEIFITATLEQNDFHRVSSAIEQTLTNLGTDYVDLLLMNWPDVGCGNDNPEGRSRIWRQLEEHYQDGVCKAIGVANFCSRQLRPLVNDCRVYPHVIQCEMHPLNFDKYLLHYCRENGIVVQAHSPFGGGGIIDQPTIRRVAALYGRPPTQILVKWALRRGVCVVPGARRRKHVAENMSVWDFTLDSNDVRTLNDLNNNVYSHRDPRPIP